MAAAGDYSAKQFAERAVGMGYGQSVDGKNQLDFARILRVLGEEPGAAPGQQLVDWHDKRGNTYRQAITLLNAALKPAGEELSGERGSATAAGAPVDARPPELVESGAGGAA